MGTQRPSLLARCRSCCDQSAAAVCHVPRAVPAQSLKGQRLARAPRGRGHIAFTGGTPWWLLDLRGLTGLDGEQGQRKVRPWTGPAARSRARQEERPPCTATVPARAGSDTARPLGALPADPSAVKCVSYLFRPWPPGLPQPPGRGRAWDSESPPLSTQRVCRACSAGPRGN